MTSIIEDENFTEIETNTIINVGDIDDKNYLIRCPTCYEITMLKSADFKNNIFVIECYNSHIISYHSYDSFIKSTFINLNNILCHNCKKSNEKDAEFYRCNDCFLFLCQECKLNHEKEVDHSSFVKLNIMDSKLNINHKIPKLKDIEEDCSMIEKNLEKIQNIDKYFDMLLKEFITFKNNFMDTLKNYYLTQKKLANYLKNNFINNNDKCNYQAITNYETFHNNNEIVNKYIEKINYSFNISFVEKGDIESNSNIFIKLVQRFKLNNFFSIKKDETIKKIDEMEKLASDDQQEVTSFAFFNNGKNIIFGLKKGTIKIYDFKKNISDLESLNLILEIEEFKNEIKHICQLDINLFAASDEKNNIKIIEYKGNIQKYILIQDLENNSGKINSMINLPNLSQRNNNNYFCTTDNENISLYKMDKSSDNKNNRFSLMKKIAINTQIYCIIEVDENYIVAACSQAKSIKFFDINDEFQEKSEIKNIRVMAGNNTMTLIPNKNMLIVACVDGFNIINVQNLKKYRFVHCKYKVLSLDMISSDQVICCTKNESYDTIEIKLKQYKINEDDFTFQKITEKNIDDGQEIWKLKAINKKIFYLKSNYEINGLA